MFPNDLMLAAIAEIGAIRSVVVHAIALRLLEEPDPLQTLAVMDRQITAEPTLPADTAGALDPAMSDLLAALTDDRRQALVDDVNKQLATILSGG